MAKSTVGRSSGPGKLEMMQLQQPLRRPSKKDKGRPSGPKPVKIRAEQEDK